MQSFDWTRRVGLAAIEPKGALECAFPDSLPPGTFVTLVWLEPPQRVTHARILAPRDTPWEVAGTPVEGRSYELRAEDDAGTAAAFAVAISGEIGAASVEHGRVLIDLDGDGQRESFRVCSSAEGLHLSVWSGEPLESPQDWHRYVYLGMDLEVSCTAGDAP